ncbi:lipid II flippase Amj family protein [Candidatus Thioglobus sp.]|nr:lipid II flippase Amj family protein [Candidatus Thioglobus sp.]
MQFIETVSFGSRLAGKLVNRLSLGTTLQHSIFVASRLFLPPLLLSLSLLIESGLSIQLFLLTATILTITAFFTSLLVLINFNYFQLLFQRVFAQYESTTIPVAIIKALFGKKNKLNQVKLESTPRIRNLSFKKISASSFAYFFLSTGFLIAFSLAILLPEYRMTMSQSTTIFHGIGAIILAMYIDPMISKSLDVELENPYWLENIYSIFIGRLLAYLLASSIFLAFYLYTY